MLRTPFVLLALLLLPAAASPAASPPEAGGIQWQLFARGSTAKVYFDRGSVREEDAYVRFRMRIEYSAPRTSRDRRYRYGSAISEMAGECKSHKVAIVSAKAQGAVLEDVVRDDRRNLELVRIARRAGAA